MRARWMGGGMLALLAMAQPVQHAWATKILAGPMVGAVTDTSARLWMQLDTSEDVSVAAVDVMTGQQTGAVRMLVSGPSPFICAAALPNLQPDRDYRVVVKFEGKDVDLPPPVVKIHTMPVAGLAANFTVALGAGIEPGANLDIFRTIADAEPRAMVFAGNVLHLPDELAGWPHARIDAYRMICAAQHRLRTAPELQPLLRRTACYATWDEHDFGTAGAGQQFVFSPESRVAFQVFWPNPSYGTAAAPGIYTQFTIGDVDFFLLDNRTYRTRLGARPAATEPGEPAPVLLGSQQVAWLEKQLAASRATFKVIISGGPMLARERGSWSDFPEERDAFLKWLFAQHITGVFFAGGHEGFGELSQRPANVRVQGDYPLFELSSGPLAGKPAGAVPGGEAGAAAGQGLDEVNALRVGQMVRGDQFGTLEFAGPAGHRHVTLRLRDRNGRMLLQQIILAETLQ